MGEYKGVLLRVYGVYATNIYRVPAKTKGTFFLPIFFLFRSFFRLCMPVLMCVYKLCAAVGSIVQFQR